MFAGSVIYLIRVLRDLLILAAAGTGAWFLSYGAAVIVDSTGTGAAIRQFIEQPSNDVAGDGDEWALTVTVALGYPILLRFLWRALAVSAPRLGRTVFAERLLGVLMVSVAPLPFLLTYGNGAPAWTVPAVPGAVWGSWLLYLALRKLQRIDQQARTGRG